ncbi:DUF4407 domain-containing protein [Mycolicibacterium arenosum]|uniref:DUF4407 domain-containing protein n=1 Tax=Mycolicibacterium arenosum TaxID=2952157 RepID=A0ABT1M024_9MYCO|nr:DUF4407 domain-containing protein [Mycolicibacterium sp. CAU 1645]MCP9272496.1 DUF4407 domain-containing protein [Mycolicibacterium sp. CAU 1645]
MCDDGFTHAGVMTPPQLNITEFPGVSMFDKRFPAALTWPRGIAYAIAAVVLGVVVGELAAMLIFAGSSDRRLDDQAVRGADTAPAVVAAAGDLERARQARAALDDDVTEASRRRDDALVVARCEFSAAPQCPPTRITGVPGAGPGLRTADEFLADAQRSLDRAESERDRLAPALDAAVAADQAALTRARDAAIAGADRGFGARWLAMNAHTLASPAAIVLRALLTGVFVLAFLFPLLLRISRAKTTEDRRASALAERERADIEADTAIAVKKAEVRAAVETMWAERELESARLAVAAQAEIDSEEQRRRVASALEVPTRVASERVPEVVAESPVDEPAALPAVRETLPARRTVLPVVPEVAEAAARWMRPFVPPIIASAIDTTTRPLRAARQVYEETEEIHFSLRRSHRVSVTTEQTEDTAEPVEEVLVVEVDGPKRPAHSAIRAGDDVRELPPADS